MPVAPEGPKYKWDFFIAHAGPDLSSAERLFDHLAKASRPFLASRCLTYGDDWDTELAKAQRASHVTVVLVSASTPSAYYQREEIAAAIHMARQGGNHEHRVVPVYLPGATSFFDETPYGLRSKHGMTVASLQELGVVGDQLLNLHQVSRDVELRSPTVSTRPGTVGLSSLRFLPQIATLKAGETVAGTTAFNELKAELMRQGTREESASLMAMQELLDLRHEYLRSLVQNFRP